jgi:hypothetical protein
MGMSRGFADYRQRMPHYRRNAKGEPEKTKLFCSRDSARPQSALALARRAITARLQSMRYGETDIM